MGVLLDFSALDAIRGNKQTQSDGFIQIDLGNKLFKCPWDEPDAQGVPNTTDV